MPPFKGTDAAANPDPIPRGTTGISICQASCMSALTWSVESGLTTTSGLRSANVLSYE